MLLIQKIKKSHKEGVTGTPGTPPPPPRYALDNRLQLFSDQKMDTESTEILGLIF